MGERATTNPAYGGWPQGTGSEEIQASVGGARIAYPILPAPATLPTALANGLSWVAASGGSTGNGVAYTKAHPSGRTTGNVFTKNPTSGTFGGERVTPLIPFKMTDFAILGMDVNPQLISGSVTLRVSSDNFATKRMEYSWPLPAEAYASEWNRLTARTNADGTIDPNGGTWVVTGGMTTAETVNSLQLSINTTANDAARVDLDSVFGFTATPVRGVVMFGFDRYEDTSLPAIALPIAQKYGITCYAAGDTDKVVTLGAAYTRVKQLHDAGWPIVSQGPDHKDYVSVGTGQMLTDVRKSRNDLQGIGLSNALRYFAYPFSSNNAATDALLLNNDFRFASTGINWNGKPSEYGLGYKLIGQGRINIGALTLAQVKLLIDRARIYGVVVDLFCHGLVAGGTGTTPPADPLTWYANDWDAAIAYAKTFSDAGTLDILNPVTLSHARGSLPVRA